MKTLLLIIVMITVAVLLFLAGLILPSKGTLQNCCPKCGSDLDFKILDEKNANGYFFVVYKCKKCGFIVKLPQDDNKSEEETK